MNNDFLSVPRTKLMYVNLTWILYEHQAKVSHNLERLLYWTSTLSYIMEVDLKMCVIYCTGTVFIYDTEIFKGVVDYD